MKTFILLAATFALSAHATETTSAKSLALDYTLKVISKKSTMEMKSHVMLDPASKGWQALGGSVEHHILLGRLAELDGEKVKMEFLVIDDSAGKSEKPAVANMTAIAMVGQKAQIRMGTDDASSAVEFIVTK
jgi:hypothetical protein